MGKINFQEVLTKANHAIRNVMGLNKYAETQEEVDKKLTAIDKNIEQLVEMNTNLANGVKETSAELAELKQSNDKQFQELNATMDAIKSGLQKELFQSLREYHDKFVHRGWASYEEKQEARIYYDEIHALHSDGFSQKYMEEIDALPDSKKQYYANVGD